MSRVLGGSWGGGARFLMSEVPLHPVGHVTTGFFCRKRELFVDNLLVRIHSIMAIISWTDLAPWDFAFPFPGSLTSTFLDSFVDLVQCGWRGDGGWRWYWVGGSWLQQIIFTPSHFLLCYEHSRSTAVLGFQLSKMMRSPPCSLPE